MAVRSRLPWPWRALLAVLLLSIIGGMWWWGFDFGQFFGGVSRQESEARMDALESGNVELRKENARLKSKSVEQETELAMASGKEATLSKQALELSAENAQLKEELAFLQKFFGDTGKQGSISIQRLTAERERDDAYRFSLLVVRGGNPSGDFSGQLTLQAGLVAGGQPATIALPDDQPDAAETLKLKFKYYQRIEGMIRVPPGSQLRTLQAKVLETGQPMPKATRSLNLT